MYPEDKLVSLLFADARVTWGWASDGLRVFTLPTFPVHTHQKARKEAKEQDKRAESLKGQLAERIEG